MKAKKRSFVLYRLGGMMGNLAHMLYELYHDDEIADRISEAMNAVSKLEHYIRNTITIDNEKP